MNIKRLFLSFFIFFISQSFADREYVTWQTENVQFTREACDALLRQLKQKIKNNIKNGRSAGHESRYYYTSQADRFCHKLPKKKKKEKKANQNHENLPLFPLIQGLPLSN